MKAIISGGGTGGHVFPAIAIANALRKKYPDAAIQFIGATGKMEMEKVPAAGYPIEGLWISGFHRRITVKNLLFPLKVFLSLRKASKIIKTFQPDVVIGSGGYASGPTLRMAAKSGIPTVILEQNSYPGMTNKLLADAVDRICVAYEGMEGYFPAEKIVLTGNPIRQDITDPTDKKSEAYIFFGIDPSLKTVLVIGGSLGARTINESIAFNLSFFGDNNIQVIWQTGKMYHREARASVAGKSKGNIRIFDFIQRMDLAYACADVIISRAGAIAISELCMAGKPAILIPSPSVVADHQTKNVKALVERNAAIYLKDHEARERISQVIQELFQNPERMTMFGNNIREMAKPDAADRIVEVIVSLIQHNQ